MRLDLGNFSRQKISAAIRSFRTERFDFNCTIRHACLPSWETRAQALVGFATQSRKIIHEKGLPLL